MTLFECLTIVSLLIAGAFAILMLWYHTSKELEKTRFENQDKVSQNISDRVKSLTDEVARFRERMDGLIGGLSTRVNALELAFTKEVVELKAAEKQTQEAYRRFSAEFDQLKKGWGQPMGGDRFLVPEPKKK